MASTKQSQIKVNLPTQLKEYIDSRAGQYGYTTANYVKHLILRDAQSIEYPTYKLSQKAEIELEEALSSRVKAHKIDDVKKFFDEL